MAYLTLRPLYSTRIASLGQDETWKSSTSTFALGKMTGPLAISKMCLGHRPERRIANGLSLFVSVLQQLPWLTRSERITTTFFDSKSSASCRIQLTPVTANLQLPGAAHGLVLGSVCLKQRPTNENIQRRWSDASIGRDPNQLYSVDIVDADWTAT